ncbi:MAG TPA: hypothetical protein EYO73_10715 [Sulfurimonas sp.]|nr:hypothetical protein [Sulfurimonas sp.]
MNNFLKRIKDKKGMSGVLVALLLVIVGVGLVGGVNIYMQGASQNIQAGADTAINKAITDAATAP